MTNIIVTNLEEIQSFIENSMRKIMNESVSNTSKPDEGNKYLNMKDASKYLGVKKGTLYQYTSKSLIKYINKSRQNLFKVEWLDEFLETGNKQSIHGIYDEILKGRKHGK